MRAVGCVLLMLVVVHGCSRFPKAPSKPKLKPAESAALAMEKYDADKNGLIDEKEVAASPGMQAALAKGKIDKNADGAIDADEIVERIKYYKNARTTIINGEVQINYKNKPLAEALVTFEPEDFLGEAFESSSGVTDNYGRTSMMGSDALYPGIYLGFYRVTISKERTNGKEMLPAKYNTETTLGFEAAEDDELVSNIITFDLK